MVTRRDVLERTLALGAGAGAAAGAAGARLDIGAVGTVGASEHDGSLFHVDFESAQVGDYDPAGTNWGGHDLDVVSDEYLSVVEADGRNVLDARFPAGVAGAGNTNGGGDFIVDLGEPREELYCAYRVRFDEEFEFHQPGGKLPGLAGTHPDVDERSVTGGDEPTGENGWSARMMWRDPPNPEDGGLVMFYTYHPDMPDEYGENMYWDDGPSGQVHFRRGEWHRIEHRVVMNTPGEHDGILEGWFDGEKAFERTDLRFRDVPELGIDDFYFSLFFGGGQTEHWAHDREEHVQFDDLVVATRPIWLGDDEAPTAPADVTATPAGDAAVELSWAAASDDGPAGVDHYRVIQNGRVRERVSAGTTTATVERVVAGEPHEFGVVAVDGAGNASDPATVTVELDPIAGDVPPDAPRDVEQTARQLDWVEVAWRAPDRPADDGVSPLAHYEVAVDGEVERRVAHDEPRVRLSDLAAGTEREVAVRAVDVAGNRSDAATVTASTVPETAEDALVLHTFEDGLWPGENLLGEWAGAGDFENGAGEGAVVDGALRLEYDDGGWLRSRMESSHDVSEYDQLTLIVRGDAGGEERHCTVEVGDAGGRLSELTDDEVRTEWTAVRIDLDEIDAPATPEYVYASFAEGGVGALEVDRIRFDHADATGTEPEPECGENADAEAMQVDGQTVCNVDGDQYFRDANGDGRVGNRDVGTFFQHFHLDAWDREAFDYSGNGRVSHGDVVALFDHVV